VSLFDTIGIADRDNTLRRTLFRTCAMLNRHTPSCLAILFGLRIILLSAYSEMPERVLWLVDDYVMKSELPERLLPIIERTHRIAPRSTGRLQRREATA